MGASGEKGRKNPTRSGRTMSPLQVASSCPRAGLIFSCPITSVANSSSLCTRNNTLVVVNGFASHLGRCKRRKI